eukprot:TRINITY_DN2581_c0_g1_i2.p1 TRINITY_DN2581_c0_g1~~TRINITY_DN2581_c0_g1_i2.p1  ORF type:complete len:514 (-),score=80.09 TRINITY_DN2581_c0_g1_i2:45-1586(-)
MPQHVVDQWNKLAENLSALNLADEAQRKAKVKELQELIQGHGIPSNLRKKAWTAFAGTTESKSKFPSDYYQSLVKDINVKGSPDVLDQIDKDIKRTFPDCSKFREEEEKMLERVLKAFSIHNPSVGYAQSMNFVCAILLIVLEDEEDAFWVMVHIVEHILTGYYLSNLIGCQIDQKVVESLVEKHLPKLHKHFEETGLALSLVTIPWLLCIYLLALPMEVAIVVLDNVLYRGRYVIILTCLAILQMNENVIFQTKEGTNIAILLKDITTHTFDKSSLLKAIFSWSNIKESEIQNLATKFREELIKANFERVKQSEIYSLQRSTKLTRKELETLYSEFTKLAKRENAQEYTNTGYIQYQDFAQILPSVLPKFGKNDVELKHLWSTFDANKDQKLDYKELTIGLSTLYRCSSEKKLQFCFDVYDINKNGRLEKEELRAILFSAKQTLKLPFNLDKTVVKTFATLDKDKDGFISFGEFKQVLLVEPSLLQFFLPPEQFTSVQAEVPIAKKKSCSIM